MDIVVHYLRMRNPRSTGGEKSRPVDTRPGKSGGFLSHTAQYALRVVAELARRGSDAHVRAADLTVETGVPPHYLSKVLRRLVQRGILHSQRGHGGGFSLASSPAELTVGRVLAAVDALPGERCAFGWDRCDACAPCPLHHTWAALNERFLSWAESATFVEGRDES